jgi:hypothetical protein
MCTSSKANMCKNTYFNDTQTYQMSLIIVPRHVSYCHVWHTHCMHHTAFYSTMTIFYTTIPEFDWR